MHPLLCFLTGRSGGHAPQKIRGVCRVVAVGLLDDDKDRYIIFLLMLVQLVESKTILSPMVVTRTDTLYTTSGNVYHERGAIWREAWIPYPPPSRKAGIPSLCRRCPDASPNIRETVDESIAMAREAIELYIEDLQEKGEEIPTEEGLLEYTLCTVEPMPKLPALTPQKVIKILEKKGFVLSRVKGAITSSITLRQNAGLSSRCMGGTLRPARS